MRGSRPIIASVFACLMLLASMPQDTLAKPARDGSPANVELLAQEAKEMVEAGLYEEAIARYMKAFHLEPEALLLYNVAFIYDKKLGERDLAVEFYRRYLRHYGAETTLVRRTLARLREIQTNEPPPDEPPPDSPPDRNPSPDPVEQADSSGGIHVGWIVLGVGGASLVGGGVTGYLSERTKVLFEETTNVNDRQILKDRGEKQALAANILLGVGGATAAAGVILLLVIDDEPEEAHIAPSLRPHWSLRPDGFNVGVGGTF